MAPTPMLDFEWLIGLNRRCSLAFSGILTFNAHSLLRTVCNITTHIHTAVDIDIYHMDTLQKSRITREANAKTKQKSVVYSVP